MRRLMVLCLGVVALGLTVQPLHAQNTRPAQPQPPGGVPPGITLPGAQPPGSPQPPTFPGFPGSRADYKEIIPSLVEALKDTDPDVRTSAASALAHVGEPAVKPLLDILKDEKQDPNLRANAAYVLGHIGSNAQDILPALAKYLKDDNPHVRRRVAYAIQLLVRNNANPFQVPGMMGPGAYGTGGQTIKVEDPGLMPVERGEQSKPPKTTEPDKGTAPPDKGKEPPREDKKP